MQRSTRRVPLRALGRHRKSDGAGTVDLDEGLSLLRTFFEIGDAERRAKVMALAEHLAAENPRNKAASSD